MRKRNSGFSVIELAIVLLIISVLATILVPKLLDGIQKGKQKRTLADMRMTGTAMMSWLTDEMSAAAAGGTFDVKATPQVTHGNVTALLVPTYLQGVPGADGWGNAYDFFIENNLDSFGGQSVVLAIRSRGRDGAPDGRYYDSGSFFPQDYDSDIIWSDGFFVRWPSADATDRCDQGVGQGGEGCDPGGSNQGGPSNDENGGSPGDPGKKG
jgi:general secretion pathway protein G